MVRLPGLPRPRTSRKSQRKIKTASKTRGDIRDIVGSPYHCLLEEPMSSPLLFSAVFVSAAMLGLAHAEQRTLAVPTPVVKQATPQRVRIPGTDYELTFGTRQSPPSATLPSQALVKAIVTWLSVNFDLPRDYSYPAIKLEPAPKIATFHHTGLLSDRPQDMAAVPPGQREVIAAYDPLANTIYLPQGWSGSTTAELSVLVHEMVHHLQT